MRIGDLIKQLHEVANTAVIPPEDALLMIDVNKTIENPDLIRPGVS